MDGRIKDLKFTNYVYRIANELGKELNDAELRMLYSLKDGPRKCSLEKIKNLLEIGVVEKNFQGNFILSKKYYSYADQKGEYTRRKGLDKNTNKELIIKHLEHYKKGYMADFLEVLKDIPRATINRYLSELKNEGRIDLVGNPRIYKGNSRAYWELIK